MPRFSGRIRMRLIFRAEDVLLRVPTLLNRPAYTKLTTTDTYLYGTRSSCTN
jgi:hypothetical protein